MAIGYRAILSAEHSDENLAAIVDVLRAWVTTKKRFDSLPSKGEVVKNDVGAVLGAHEVVDRDRDVSGYRWTLTEDWSRPPWYGNEDTSRRGITQINIVFSAGQIWLWVDIEPPTLEYVDSAGRERREPQVSGTPSFVSEILGKVELHDGIESPVSYIQQIATKSHVDHLISVLKDPNRRGAVYVSSPPEGSDANQWIKKFNRILGQIEGMGFGYMLNSAVVDEFNNRVAPGHRIPRGSIRTFLPNADLSDAKDALRHRLLHAATIRESKEGRLKRIIRNAQIRRLQDLDLPEVLRDADYAFLREKSMRTFEVLHSDTAKPEQQVSIGRGDDLFRRLEEAEQFLSVALRDNAELDKSRVAARGVANELRIENEETYLDIATLRLELEESQREIQYLQRELERLGKDGAKAAYGFDRDTRIPDYPATFGELIESIDRLDGVKFFGDRVDAEELDEHSDLGDAAVMKAWDALVTFDAYARARKENKFSQSLSQYINYSQHGFPMRITKVKWSEGQTVRTNAKMIAQRTVTGLPASIDPSGSKMLVSHIAIATGRAGSPRLYFDDTVSAAGFVTVGYIGAHLDNTLTN